MSLSIRTFTLWLSGLCKLSRLGFLVVHIVAADDCNHRSRPLCWTSKKLTNAIDVHLAERLARGHGVSTRVVAFRGLEAIKKLCAGDPARLGDIVRRVI